MSCVGIGGAFLATAFILAILKQVYKGMTEDVFLKIGGNGNMWGKSRLNLSAKHRILSFVGGSKL
jgi:hypothetical protein